MEVTEVRINKVTNEESKVKAFASVTFDGELVVSGVRVIEYEKDGEKRTMVSMPNTKGNDGKYYADVFPLNKTLRENINAAVMKAYNG